MDSYVDRSAIVWKVANNLLMKSFDDLGLAVIVVSYGAQIDRLALGVVDILHGWIKWKAQDFERGM